MSPHRNNNPLHLVVRPPGTCLTPAQLEAPAENRPESGAVRTHLASCAACQSELALLREFCTAEPRDQQERQALRWLEERLSSPASTSFPTAAVAPFWRRWLAAPLPKWGFALALVVLAAGISLQISRSPESLSRDTDSHSSGVLRSARIRLLEPLGGRTSSPETLTWEAAPGADHYRVVLSEVDGTEIWTEESREPRVALTTAVRKLFVAHKTLLWRVSARDAQGRTLAESEPGRVRVKP